MCRILFIDDNSETVEAIAMRLARARPGWNIRTITSSQRALRLLDTEPADVVVTDLRMPVLNGEALLGRIKKHHPQTVRVVLSGDAGAALAAKVASLCHFFLKKPCLASEMLKVLDQVCESHGVAESS